jgi:aspartate kinase
MISQSSSETNITIAVRLSDIPSCRQLLASAFKGDAAVREIRFDEQVSIVSVVGSGMKGVPGVAAGIFIAVAEVGVSVIMIAQGSSELNISFLVRRQDSERVVSAIHREFRLHEVSGA